MSGIIGGGPKLDVINYPGRNANAYCVPIPTINGGIAIHAIGGLTKLEHAAGAIAAQMSNRIELGEYASEEEKQKALMSCAATSVALACFVLDQCEQIQATIEKQEGRS